MAEWTKVGAPVKIGAHWGYECICTCGKRKHVRTGADGNLRSKCCFQCAMRGHKFLYEHGHTWKGGCTPTYRSWRAMLDRCEADDIWHAERYANRGIRICERWEKFENFLADMGERPSVDYSIDRINNDGNYEPGNCRWATRQEQGRNRGNNALMRFRGEIKTVAEVADAIGMRRDVIYDRRKAGWSDERIISTPVRPRRMAQ